jgi:predicted lipoprotein with Yx(FWY)xxD motif
MKRKATYTGLIALAVAAIVLVASACGGSDDTGAEGSAPESTAGTTISVGSAEGVGDVLVGEDGSALYASVEEASGMVLCVDACAAIWQPLTLSDGQPTGSDGLTDNLGVVARPDGARQVTFNDRPLYTFIEDPGAGSVTGNGFADTFGDQLFTWHVATPAGISMSSANSSESADNGTYLP